MSQGQPFYVTTPIYYVNDVPHIGHTYTTIVADVIARYKRMRGFDVRFVTGTDEHGINIQRAADKKGIKPIELADQVVARYHDLWGPEKLGITHDDFIRTTQPRHHDAVQRLFRKVREAGDIYEGSYAGWYCPSCEAFYPESQLAEGKCPVHERPTEWLEEPSYFFRLSKYQQPLLDLYAERPEFVMPAGRRNEIVSFVQSGLKDLSVSRATVTWGIPVPDTPGQVIYVWFDALTNYISALGYGSPDPGLYRRFWDTGEKAGRWSVAPAVHLVGKDILRFHSVYWPAFLMSAGEPIPRTVFAHGWWLNDEKKMSKTTGNVIRPGPLLAVFGADALRHFLMREMTFGLDGSFSYEAVVERVNADLANNLGNLLSRVVTLVSRLPGGRVPQYFGEALPEAESIRTRGRETHRGFMRAFDACDFSVGLATVWSLLDEINRLLVVHQPWRTAADRTQEKISSSVLHEAAAALRMTAALISPVCPALAREIWSQLGLDGDPGAVRLDSLAWEEMTSTEVRPGKPLYSRIEKARALAEIERLAREDATTPPITRGAPAKSKEKTMEAVPPAGLITIDQFMNADLRVAKVESAERVAGAKKLLRLIVDLGTEKRQIVAGIAEVYAPEDLVGKLLVVVVNLQPAVVRGVESRGMLLAADAPGRPIIATFETPVPPGTRVR